MRSSTAALLSLLTLLCSGCGWQMAEQPRYDSYEPSPLTANGSSAQVAPAATVARVDSEMEARPALTRELLERGRERYGITCALCHGETGHGDGRIVKHGFPAPPSFHSERLRQAEDAHFWSAISNGAGRMLPYANRVAPRDRWAIVEWIRVLQLSEHPPGEAAAPSGGPATAATPAESDGGPL